MNIIYQTLLDSKLLSLKNELEEEFTRLKIGNDEQRKISYSFLVFSMMSICDIGIEDAISCSTEGGGDLNIDGFYIDTSKNAIHVHLF